MKKLLLLVLTLTASASPPFQEEKLPFRDQPFDHVVKVDVLPVVKKEPIVQNTKEEQGPLMQDEPVADVVDPDSVLLKPETTEEHRVSEKTAEMVEEPVLKADNLTPETKLEPETVANENTNNVPVQEPVLEADVLTEETPETELEPELEISVEEPVLEADVLTEETPETELEPELEISVEEPVLEADVLTEETPETELEPELEISVEEPVLKADDLTPETELEPELEISVEEPVLEADYLTQETPETELEPELEIDPIQKNRNNVPAEEPVLEEDYLTEETPETELETELEIDAIEMNRNVPVEEPVLAADYLIEETPETELEPEPEMVAIEMNTNNVPVEEPVVEMESVDEMVVESEKEEKLLKEPTLEDDYIVAEDLEEVMEPVRERRMALKTGRWTCRGVVLQGKCYQFFRRTLNADAAELQCQEICPNGHLASVTSSYIREELGKLMDQYGVRTITWLGGRRVIGTNNFRWLDGAPWSYNNWGIGQPSNDGGIENCVEILSNLRFNDMPCRDIRPFICSCPL
ncbi:cytadherence high molecular weight protein 1 [Megalobrama amblycephala]|uniref:cytadherence high molecular weight protein 1 n=1 Tax=Megalobrama amblycephala TaxID=75352 RepID=UPI002013FD62|nr:cytadherence high molecular weight protein 1 [Megalobrama amblycephala]XP_048049433.1 cytadherence high molecular weight protein 1 [Megalobrama amblycephala]